MKIGFLSVGTEILLGDTVNTNLTNLGKRLYDAGFKLNKEITISDNLVGELEIGFSTPEMRDNLKIIGQPISVIFDTDGTILLREYGYVPSDL